MTRGAGGRSVRFNGRVFEAIEALRGHRERCELFHAALVVAIDVLVHDNHVVPDIGEALIHARRHVVRSGHALRARA